MNIIDSFSKFVWAGYFVALKAMNSTAIANALIILRTDNSLDK